MPKVEARFDWMEGVIPLIRQGPALSPKLGSHIHHFLTITVPNKVPYCRYLRAPSKRDYGRSRGCLGIGGHLRCSLALLMRDIVHMVHPYSACSKCDDSMSGHLDMCTE